MKVLFTLLTLLLIICRASGQTNIFPGTGNAGIGTISPVSKLDIKQGIDEGISGTSFIAPYYIGRTNDVGGGAPLQYILLSPAISQTPGSPSAGLSGILSFYRGTAGSYNVNAEYRVIIQSAYSEDHVMVSPMNGNTRLIDIYKVTYNSRNYFAIKSSDPATAALRVNYRGDWWNNIDGSRPRLVLASDVSNVSIYKISESAYGNMIFGTTAGYVGLGTSTPKYTLEVNTTSSGEQSSIGIEKANTTGNPLDQPTSKISYSWYGSTKASINFHRGGSSTDGFISFSTSTNNNPIERMRIYKNGNVLIGKTAQINSSYKLDVAGSVRSDKVVVNITGADFVFDSTYQLLSLPTLEQYLKEQHHLPDIVPAKEMQSNGIDVGELQTKLLKKIEELTLYIIDQDKELATRKKIDSQLVKRMNIQKHRIADQDMRIAAMEALIKKIPVEKMGNTNH